MKIIVSPAKRMREDDSLPWHDLPVYLAEAQQLKDVISSLSYPEKKKVWACNDRIAENMENRFMHMNLKSALTPAVLSYDGIQYQYMAPEAFDEEQFAYIQANLYILSGFYGVLKPFDGVTPYRLEMNAKLSFGGFRDLYAFWQDKIYQKVMDESRILINLASLEYSKAVKPYLQKEDRMITCIFGIEENGRVVQKGVYAKMARGAMSRWMAERNVKEPEELKQFDELKYRYSEKYSTDQEYVFLQIP
jgi:cytoplasmic iron level regulating protein YaaA (DUF328/UPF0246 family)